MRESMLAIAESGISVSSLLSLKVLLETRNNDRKNSAERIDYEEELALLKA